ncbi:MAG: peptide chain release factor N(5)-glutamine methyltransferase [Thermoguttaceae bacterium]
MSTAEPWTVGRLLQWTTDYLKSHDADSPRLDAEVLLAHALGCQRIQLYTTFDKTPGDPQRTAFRELVRQRAEGKPVAYLVGRKEFYSLSFHVTPDVLIPRPETELLVVASLDFLKKKAEAATQPAAPQIADVGTGSGAIAVCLAKHWPACRVTAIDLSPTALAVARTNAVQHGVSDRIDLIESDLFAAVPSDRSFDLVVSNPPYITTAEMDRLAVDVRRFEPRLALEAGPRGTEVIERLIVQSAERLRPGGQLLLEISPTIHAAVRTLLESDARWSLGPTIEDLARQPRVIQAERRE